MKNADWPVNCEAETLYPVIDSKECWISCYCCPVIEVKNADWPV